MPDTPPPRSAAPERVPGWYWVRQKRVTDTWDVAYWSRGDAWWVCGYERAIEVDEIDERPITRPATPAPEPSGLAWRTIDSAPKDGTAVLIISNYNDVSVARWNERKSTWDCLADGFHAIEHMSDFGTEYRTVDVAAAWQPLPVPPRAEGGGS